MAHGTISGMRVRHRTSGAELSGRNAAWEGHISTRTRVGSLQQQQQQLEGETGCVPSNDGWYGICMMRATRKKQKQRALLLQKIKVSWQTVDCSVIYVPRGISVDLQYAVRVEYHITQDRKIQTLICAAPPSCSSSRCPTCWGLPSPCWCSTACASPSWRRPVSIHSRQPQPFHSRHRSKRRSKERKMFRHARAKRHIRYVSQLFDFEVGCLSCPTNTKRHAATRRWWGRQRHSEIHAALLQQDHPTKVGPSYVFPHSTAGATTNTPFSAPKVDRLYFPHASP